MAMKERFTVTELCALRNDPDPGGMVDSRDAAELLQVSWRAAATGVSQTAASTPPDASKCRLFSPCSSGTGRPALSCSSGARCHQNSFIDTTVKTQMKTTFTGN